MKLQRHTGFLVILLWLCPFLFAGCASVGNQTDISVYGQQANQAYSQGNYKLASEKYRVLVKKDPKNSLFWFRLANAYAKDNEHEKAVKAYQKTLSLEPGYTKAWYNMGLMQMQLALKTFLDFQKTVPPDNPIRIKTDQNIDGLFQLLGKKPASKENTNRAE